jgi:hypothetical protein
MSNYDQEYYLPFAPMDDSKLFAGLDKKSTFRVYVHDNLNLVDGPLFFHNSYKDEDKKEGVITPIPDIIVRHGQMVIPKEFMRFLRRLDIPGMQLFPSIYIDDDDKWHESLWLIHFFERLDCLDRENSDIDYDPDIWEKGDELIVEKTSISDAALSVIPEEQRLIFKMADVKGSHLFCHQRVVDFIREMKYTGVLFIKVSDFKEGMQNHLNFDGVKTY